MTALADRRIITHRGEFIDALRLLRDGHVLVRAGDGVFSYVLVGAVMHHSYSTLCDDGLIDEFDNPSGFAGLQYYRISERGREFADRACSRWRELGILQRLAVRLVG